MKAVVTGGAGFVGRCLARLLIDRGWSVTVLDDFSTGLRVAHQPPEIRILEGDILSFDDLAGLFGQTDVVFHLAAVPRWYGESKPLYCLEVNGLGTLHTLLAAQRAGLGHFVHVSSGSVCIGLDVDVDSPCKPRSLYGLSKAVGEQYAEFFRRHFTVSILRPFHIYGAGIGPASENIFTRFITAALENGPLTVYGDGNQRLSATWVDDVARACLWALDLPGSYTVAGEVVTVNELADLMIGFVGSGHKEYVEMPNWAYGDHTGRSERLLHTGFTFKGRLAERLPETIAWLKERGSRR